MRAWARQLLPFLALPKWSRNARQLGRLMVVPSNAIKRNSCHRNCLPCDFLEAFGQEHQQCGPKAQRHPLSRLDEGFLGHGRWIATARIVLGSFVLATPPRISAGCRQGRMLPLLAVFQKFDGQHEHCGKRLGPMEGRREPQHHQRGQCQGGVAQTTPALRAASPNTDDGRNLANTRKSC